MSGLSPLARGTPLKMPFREFRIRFIPAGAGNTAVSGLVGLPPPVYPRWRGEHPHILSEQFITCRFIPAGAGNTPAMMPTLHLLSVYPRWRGEHISLPYAYLRVFGLSPLARGTPLYVALEILSRRFIPAGAGNTKVDLHLIRLAAVYPRWRGEH